MVVNLRMTGTSQTEMVGYRCLVLIRCWYSSAVSLCSLWFGQKGILKCLWKGPWRLLDKYNSCYYFFVLTFLPHLNSPITQTIYFPRNSEEFWGEWTWEVCVVLCCPVAQRVSETMTCLWQVCVRNKFLKKTLQEDDKIEPLNLSPCIYVWTK